jgi:methylase of polypeptide subunit release factors
VSRPDGPPLRRGTDQHRAAIRQLANRAGYTEAALRERFDVASIDVLVQRLDPPRPTHSPDALDVCADLFVRSVTVPQDGVAAALGEEALAALLATDLLRSTNGACASPVLFVPIGTGDGSDLLIASDVPPRDPTAGRPDADFVFSAHNPLTRQFLDLLPRAGYDTALDLGTGTGVGAIAAAGRASRVAAVDITDRSAHFAQFNAWLNARAVDVYAGDLYAPVAGQAFDCVLAHPPYVPTLKSRAVYRDGGETGESITRRVVEGLPAHLTAAGLFLMPSIAMDTREGLYEERVRRWLGPASREFDLVFAVADVKSPAAFAADLAGRVSDPLPDEADQWTSRFAQWGVEHVAYGALAARRFDAADGPAQTRRVRLVDETRFESFVWLFDRFARMRRRDYAASLLASAPRLAPSTRMRIEHVVRDGRLVPAECRFENGGAPFPSTLRVDPWVASFVQDCDGSSTAADLIPRVQRQAGTEIGADAIVELVSLLAERGLIEM